MGRGDYFVACAPRVLHNHSIRHRWETDAYSLALSCGDRTSRHTRADLIL